MRKTGDVNCILALDFESLREQVRVLEESLEFDTENQALRNVINILHAIQMQAVNRFNGFSKQEVYGG